MILKSNFYRTIKLGVKNLLLHTGRSILTMLGIIFGVGSVIAMLAVGEGASAHQQEAIRRMGSTNIILKSMKPSKDELSGNDTQRQRTLAYGLTYLDAWRIDQTLPYVKRILPVRELRDEAQYRRNKFEVKIVATIPAYQDLQGLVLKEGRFISDADQRNQTNVCAMTENMARKLFGFDNALGNAVRIGSFYYRVVGIVESSTREIEKSEFGQWGLEVYVPLATVRSLYGDTITKGEAGSFSSEKVELHRIIIQCSETERVEDVALGVQRILERFHDNMDYEMTVPLRLLRQAQETKRVFTIVLGSIAAISLLVGGIGIMNIMLATVTERTREIGIRRALGARRRDIVTQFLVETIVLSIGGGAIGVAFGVIVPSQIQDLTDIPTIVTVWSLGIAFTVSALIGVVFGLYPAVRAANLDPIEALRHE